MATELDVLIIEDNAPTRKLLEDVLQTAGFYCLSTETAEEGIHLAREHCPRFILMDIMLPGMNGLVATQLLRQEPALTDTCFIGMSAHAMKTEKKIIDQARFDLFLVKPFSYKVLLDYLAKLQKLP